MVNSLVVARAEVLALFDILLQKWHWQSFQKTSFSFKNKKRSKVGFLALSKKNAVSTYYLTTHCLINIY